jgi:hypothetical protein
MRKSHFLILNSAKCREQSFLEWGRDEIYFFGFGMELNSNITMMFNPISLGSFGDGSLNPDWNQTTPLFGQFSVADNGPYHIFWKFWLIEKDRGHLTTTDFSFFAETLAEKQVHFQSLGLSFRESRLIAFNETVVEIRLKMDRRARHWWNSDDISPSISFDFSADSAPVQGLTQANFGGPSLATYELEFKYSIEDEPIIE